MPQPPLTGRAKTPLRPIPRIVRITVTRTIGDESSSGAQCCATRISEGQAQDYWVMTRPRTVRTNSIDCSAWTRRSHRRRRSGAKQATPNSDEKNRYLIDLPDVRPPNRRSWVSVDQSQQSLFVSMKTGPVMQLIPLSVSTVIDGVVFTVFDGPWGWHRGRSGGASRGRRRVKRLRRSFASLRYGPAGDPPPSTRRSDDLPVAAAQVEIGVAPGVQLTASPQRLTGAGGAALARVVHEQDRGVEAALEIAQEAEDRGDVGDGVLVDAVEPDQRVEDHEARPDALDRLLQCCSPPS